MNDDFHVRPAGGLLALSVPPRGPIHRLCSESKYSTTGCGTPLYDLDWSQWWMDKWDHNSSIHIHVRKLREPGKSPDHDTWHRVYPKRIAGRMVARISVKDGLPYWLHDKRNSESNKPPSA